MSPKPKKIGRPSKKTDAIIEEVCRRLSKGEPLAVICRDEGMPCPNTVRSWAERDPALSERIARAREDGEDWLAAECLSIADDGTNDWMERLNKDGEAVGYALNGEAVARSKLRVETRLKLLAKWNPKKYGDFQRNEITGKDGKDLIPATINIKGVKAPRREE